MSGQVARAGEAVQAVCALEGSAFGSWSLVIDRLVGWAPFVVPDLWLGIICVMCIPLSVLFWFSLFKSDLSGFVLVAFGLMVVPVIAVVWVVDIFWARRLVGVSVVVMVVVFLWFRYNLVLPMDVFGRPMWEGSEVHGRHGVCGVGSSDGVGVGRKDIRRFMRVGLWVE